MKVFLDANVLFAASDPAKPTAQLIDLLLRSANAVTCDYAVVEATRNIQLKWPGRESHRAALMKRIEIVATVQFPLPVELVEKDAPILCSAIRSGSTHLATGDKRHFGHLYDHAVQGVTVVSLLRLAELLRSL